MHKRSKRVAGLLREEISRIIMKDLNNPNVGMVTITEVRISDDLKFAKVYASILGDADVRKKNMAELERAGRYIRSELASRLSLRYVPELKFVCDQSLDYAQRIDSLLNQIQKDQNDETKHRE